MSGVLNTLSRLRHVLDVHLRTAAATVTPPKNRATGLVAIRVGQNVTHRIYSLGKEGTVKIEKRK